MDFLLVGHIPITLALRTLSGGTRNSIVTAGVIRRFIDRQRLLLAKEREAEVERTGLLLTNCGPKLLEQKGLSLGGLGIVGISIGLGGKTLIDLERPSAYHSSQVFPPHTFRPGDIARIEPNVTSNTSTRKAKPTTAETKSSHAEGVVYKISDTRIVIAVDAAETNSDELNLPERCRVVKLANSVTYDRMDNAINQLQKIVLNSTGGDFTTLIQVLLGLKPPSGRLPAKNLVFFDDTLNDSQKAAVRFAVESPEVACIHGPPGTGKTHTLIEIIRQLTTQSDANPQHKRVLVCGASNLSVDNILERLLALPVPDKGKRLRVTRIGHPARILSQDSILESTLEVKAMKSDEAALARDVKEELDKTLETLSGKGRGAKAKAPRGAERKKLWEEVKALRKEYRQREGGVVRSVLRDSQVVLATCHTSGGRQMANQEFDVVIIDEATQALEAVCWIPIFKAKKLILAGDPMQLPPTILSVDKKKKSSESKTTIERQKDKTQAVQKQVEPVLHTVESDSEAGGSDADKVAVDAPSRKDRTFLVPPKTLETTLFERLESMYGTDIKNMLDIQYRMHEQICAFPSQTLYGSKLVSHESVASHLLQDLPNAQATSEADDLLQTPVIFIDTAGCEYFERLDGDGDEGSRCNENEATIVSRWVDKLVESGILADQIAIITPYQAQVTLLNSLLRPKHGQALEIGTVDGMQGREKEAVIISLVRSNDTREVGFLKERRRMNVAMTRAKRHLCVVGDSSTVVHGGEYLKQWIAWLEAHADIKYPGLD